MSYPVDASVLSEPTKSAPHPGVVEWLRKNERDIAVDPIILGEVRFGILLLQECAHPHGWGYIDPAAPRLKVARATA